MKYQVIDNNGRIEVSAEPDRSKYPTYLSYMNDYADWKAGKIGNLNPIPTLETDRNHWIPLVNTVIDESQVEITQIGGKEPTYDDPAGESGDYYAIPAIAPKEEEITWEQAFKEAILYRCNRISDPTTEIGDIIDYFKKTFHSPVKSNSI